MMQEAKDNRKANAFNFYNSLTPLTPKQKKR